MTSQGLGEPFGPGEKIIGYQVCRLKSKAYVGIDEKEEPEKGWRKSRISIVVMRWFFVIYRALIPIRSMKFYPVRRVYYRRALTMCL